MERILLNKVKNNNNEKHNNNEKQKIELNNPAGIFYALTNLTNIEFDEMK